MRKIKWRSNMGLKICLTVIIIIIGNIILFWGQKGTVKFDIKTDSDSNVMIFYDNHEDYPYDDQHITTKENTFSNEVRKISFDIPGNSFNKLRIDFGDSPVKVSLSNFRIKTFLFEYNLNPQDFIAVFNVINEIGDYKVDKSEIILVTNGNDGFITAENIIERSNKEISLDFIIVQCIILLFAFLIFNLKKIEKYFFRIIDSLNNKEVNKKNITIFCFLVFLWMRIEMLIKFYGYYAFDEFYHIATTNYDFITDYSRAIYINKVVNIITSLFGCSFYTVKSVPLLLGCISFSGFLLLSNKLFKRPLSILLASFVYIFNPLIIFNHMYIRMFIFLEAGIVVSMVLLYYALEYKVQNKNRYSNLLLILFITILGSYTLYTKDDSRLQSAAICIAVLLLYFFQSKIIMLLDKIRFNKKYKAITLTLVILILLLFISLKPSKLMFSSGESSRWTSQYQVDSPVLLLYFLSHSIILLLLFGLSGIYILKNETRYIVLYAMSLLPVSAYLLLFYDSYVLRTFVPFMPGLILFAYFFIDTNRYISGRWTYAAIAGTIILIVASYQDYDITKFYKQPYIKNETVINDIGGAVELASEEQMKGKKLATILLTDMQMYYFRMKPNYNMNLYSDGTNRINKFSNDEYIRMINEITNSSVETVLLLDNGGIDKLWELGIYNDFLERYKYQVFNSSLVIFYIIPQDFSLFH